MVYVGIDIGGMSIKVGFVDKNGKILSRFVRKTVEGEDGETTIRIIGQMINKHAEENNYKILGIGAGVPGAINVSKGTCDSSANLGWSELPIVDILKNVTKCENVRIANDANAAILGEAKFGIANGYQNLVMLTLGTGVGGGLFLNGQLYEGNEGKGAELGHMIISYNGRECGCGRKGCFERYASATALICDTTEAMLKHPESKMWEFVGGDINKVDGRTSFETAKLGDKVAQDVVNQYIEYLATGILSFCNIFRPEAIILGGGVCAQGDNLLKPLIKVLQREDYGYKCTPKVKLLIASLGNDAGILGAAALVM